MDKELIKLGMLLFAVALGVYLLVPRFAPMFYNGWLTLAVVIGGVIAIILAFKPKA